MIPVLASMLMYTSCNESEVEIITQAKEKQTTYLGGKKITIPNVSDKETYLDVFIGVSFPEWKEITYNDLLQNEKDELGNRYEKLKSNSSFTIRFYELESKRRVFGVIMNLDSEKIETEYLSGVDVPFAIIEEVLVYPGCIGTREQRAKCFSNNIRKNIAKNFNAGLAKGLGLSKGKKKIWIIFRINTKGEVVDVKARAPHPILKTEAMRVVSLLPKMKPGKQRGKAVSMKYTVPISFIVE